MNTYTVYLNSDFDETQYPSAEFSNVRLIMEIQAESEEAAILEAERRAGFDVDNGQMAASREAVLKPVTPIAYDFD